MNKYGARKVKTDGITFDSIAEYNRYCDLLLMEKGGNITDLKVHPRFVIWEGTNPRGHKPEKIIYEGDFSYTENGAHVVEDVKGVKTDVFMLKAKMFRCRYPDIDFRVIERS